MCAHRRDRFEKKISYRIIFAGLEGVFSECPTQAEGEDHDDDVPQNNVGLSTRDDGPYQVCY